MSTFSTFTYGSAVYGSTIDIVNVDLLTSKLLLIELEDEVVVDSEYYNTSNYAITGAEGSINIIRVLPVVTGLTSLNIILIIEPLIEDTLYTLDVSGVRGRASSLSVYSSVDFLARSKTKGDSLLRSVPKYLDKQPESVLSSTLLAIARQDDLIGGGYQDEFFSTTIEVQLPEIDFTNILAWFRASDEDVGSVTMVSDQSAVGNYLTQVNGTPSVAASVFNDKNGFMFSSSTRAYKPFLIAGDSSQPHTVYIVGKTDSAAAHVSFFDAGETAHARHEIRRLATGEVNIHAGTSLSTAASYGVTSPLAICAVFNGADSALYVNNFTTAAVSGNAGSNALQSMGMGAAKDNSGTANSIAEIIVYAGVHDLASRAAVAYYLNSRDYGVTVTT